MILAKSHNIVKRRELFPPIAISNYAHYARITVFLPEKGEIPPWGPYGLAPVGGTPYYLKRRVGFLWIIIFKITTFRRSEDCPIWGKQRPSRAGIEIARI